MNNDTEENQIVPDKLDDLVSTSSTSDKKKGKDIFTILVSSIMWDGSWSFQITEDTRISRIKILSLYELYGNEFDTHVGYYMLIFPAAKRSLHETKSVKEERLKNNDELELVRLPQSEEPLLQFAHHMSESAIQKATQDLPKPVPKQFLCNVVLDIQPPEFMSDIRKIMITLIEFSLKLMSIKPNAKYIFDIVRRKLMSENFFIDESLISKYKQSKATSRRIRFAISSSYNDSFSVNEWLEENKSVLSEDLGVPSSYHVDENVSIEEELNDLLKLFRQYLRASFKLCPKAMDNLLEMGFEMEHIQKALRYTGNNTSEAVEYMIGNIDPNRDGAKPGLDQGMSITSDMYKEIIAEPEIILPLCNPNILYTCLSIMDANSFLVSSIRFPTIMNLLNKILTTYYVTKCDMAMNQMLGIMPND